MDVNRKGDSSPAVSDSTGISREEIAPYYEEMVRAHLVELEVETPQGKIILKRFQEKSSPQPPSPSTLKRENQPLAEKNDSVFSSAKFIYSPIMGIFYRSSSPQSAAFVQEGESVEAGKTLCIVEAMKVMNEIKAESRCKILKILAENGKSVSKEKPLFQVEPL